jgi:acetylornithine deacetylase/succinyl-diaminopimelate desuccinylase-like protein
MTHNCVNALELGMATTLALIAWFNQRYSPHPDEERWGFLTPSTLKPTVLEVGNNKITKIPGNTEIEGDIRLTPFYDLAEARDCAVAFVAEIDRKIAADERLPGFPRVKTVDGRRGSVKLSLKGRMMEGIACDLSSPGLAALSDAIGAVRGPDKLRRFSMTGSLPLVRDLQRRGFDVQITGFGRSTYYHAPNEQAELDHFKQGFAILDQLLDRL